MNERAKNHQEQTTEGETDNSLPATDGALALDENATSNTLHDMSDNDDLNLPEPDSLSGLVDPEKPNHPDLIREDDLIIARNLRRLEIHRFEIAAALENLTDADIGEIAAEEEIDLSDIEDHYAAHLERMNKLQKNKKKLHDNSNLQLRLRNLFSSITSSDTADGSNEYQKFEGFRHQARLAWHQWRYDNEIEARLPRPQQSSRPTPEDQTAESQIHEANGEDEKTEHISELEKILFSEQSSSDQDNYDLPLCAPTRLVNWSLDCLSNYLTNASFRHFCFIDPKAGHGRTILMAAERDFQAIFGIETREDLFENAGINVAQYPRNMMTQTNIEIYSENVSPTEWPNHPLVVHIFMPPSEDWLKNLLNDLSTNFYTTPRQIYLVLIANNYTDVPKTIPFLQSFTPNKNQIETMALMSPYNIDFYYSVIKN